MKKVVLKLDLHDDKAKQKAMKAVSTLSGVDSITIDMKEKKLTVIGNIDPIVVVGKLRKSGWHAELLIVGPAKEEKKADPKKEEAKKEDKKNPNTNNNNNNNVSNYQIAAYSPYYNPNMYQPYYHVVEEDNSAGCVIS